MDFTHFSGNPGFAYSAATLLKRVPESAEHQHLHPLNLFQFTEDGFRGQNIDPEGHERVRTCATEKTLGQITLDLENVHLPIGVTFVPSLPVGRRAVPEVCLCICLSQIVLSDASPLCGGTETHRDSSHHTATEKVKTRLKKSRAEHENNKVKCPEAPRAAVWC